MRMTKNHHYKFVEDNETYYIIRYLRKKRGEEKFYEFKLLKSNDKGMSGVKTVYMLMKNKGRLKELSDMEVVLEML